MAISQECLYDWDDLAQLIKSYFKRRWIFRGVCDAGYNLVPKIGRPNVRKDARTGDPLRYDRSEERRLFDQFKREGRAFTHFTPKDNWEWLALGQHHGLPTRLLDWSESLLVAAFFAVEHADPDCAAAIYGVEEPDAVDLKCDPLLIGYCNTPLSFRPPHISRRIASQQGVFTVHPNPDQQWDSNEIICWKIPGRVCFTLKGILNFCGIHRASLFPDDPNALADHLEWLHKWGRTS